MKEYLLEDKGIYYRKNEFELNKKTVVFIHGVSGSSSAWAPYEEKFQNDYNILSFDLRGHGKSKKFNKHNDYKIKHFAEDLNFLVQYLKIEKFIIVSHSFGAFVALEFLKNYGQAVTSSVFLSPSYNMKGRFLSSFLEVIL